MAGTTETLEYTLSSRQWAILMEALRRYTRFHSEESLTEAPTGYGKRSTGYGPAADRYMVPALPGDGNASYVCWWRLTEEGAAVVKHWMDLGYTYQHIESRLTKYFPPHTHKADAPGQPPTGKAYSDTLPDPERLYEFKVFTFDD